MAAAAFYCIARLQVPGCEAVEVAVFTELILKQQRIPSQRKEQLAVLAHQIQKMLLPMPHCISEDGELMAPDRAEIQMEPPGVQGVEIAQVISQDLLPLSFVQRRCVRDKPVKVILPRVIFQPPLKKGIEVFGIIFKGGQQAAEFHHIGRLYPAKVFEPCRVQIKRHPLPVEQCQDPLKGLVLFQQLQRLARIVVPVEQVRAEKRLPHHVLLCVRQCG